MVRQVGKLPVGTGGRRKRPTQGMVIEKQYKALLKQTSAGAAGHATDTPALHIPFIVCFGRRSQLFIVYQEYHQATTTHGISSVLFAMKKCYSARHPEL